MSCSTLNMHHSRDESFHAILALVQQKSTVNSKDQEQTKKSTVNKSNKNYLCTLT